MNKLKLGFFVTLSTLTLLPFQNCSKSAIAITDNASSKVNDFNNSTENTDLVTIDDNNINICGGISCTLDPITKNTAVTTVLLALGDEADSQLVIKGGSSQLIAETIIRYTSPVKNPRILIVEDSDAHYEDPEDSRFLKDTLLSRYNTTYLVLNQRSLTISDMKDFDLIWLNNPGQPLSRIETFKALMQFEGGIVLQGDDLSRGRDFSIEALTGLKYIDNGTEVYCNGQTYHHDNNNGNKYRVQLNSQLFPGADMGLMNFEYGNDIDRTEVSRNNLEILVTAKGGSDNCHEERATIVRYLK